jgi:hypothetical protein
LGDISNEVSPFSLPKIGAKFVTFDQSKLAEAQVVQKGLQQFDRLHRPFEEMNRDGETLLVCNTCGIDFPCERMLSFMMLQGVASLTAMIPTGNMASVLKRFSGQ